MWSSTNAMRVCDDDFDIWMLLFQVEFQDICERNFTQNCCSLIHYTIIIIASGKACISVVIICVHFLLPYIFQSFTTNETDQSIDTYVVEKKVGAHAQEGHLKVSAGNDHRRVLSGRDRGAQKLLTSSSEFSSKELSYLITSARVSSFSCRRWIIIIVTVQ
uniref:Uncharacterized protein n=1 Tax=Triticum urartu TaxID=4572 RepID=A0A8R7TZ37_TRIUA